MKIKTDGFKLTIDLCDLVESLGKDDHVKLARLVAADKQLFAGVLECVASDSRLGHYFADDTDGSWWFDSAALLELREKLVPLMTEIARGAVTEALRQRNDAQQKEREATTWACRTRPETAQDREYAEWDRQDAAKASASPCQVYRLTAASRPGMACSLGTAGCPLHHGR